MNETEKSAVGERDQLAEAVRRRVLVVDDNRDSAKSLAMLVRLLGHDVETAFDGLEATEVAMAYRPEVVLLDLGLPTMDGYEAGRRIRAELGNDVVLVALTGWGEDRQRSLEAGFNQHVTKPVEVSTLKGLLDNLAARK